MENEEKNDNRQNILENAVDLFYAKGYEAVGVQEIANNAGITKPTLYYYFKSKYGLLESVLEDTIPKFIQVIDNAAKKSNSLEDGLMNVAREYINFVMGSERNMKIFYMFLSMEYSPRDSESYKAIEKYAKEIFARFLKLFTDNEKQLGNMNGRQEQFTMGFMGILNYYLLVSCDRSLSDARIKIKENEIYSLVHQFMHGIFS